MTLQNMDVGIGKVVSARLLAFKEDAGGYITYVFKNLKAEDVLHEYIMCVRFPNWDCPPINIGDEGFLSYRFVEAGKDKWYNKSTGMYEPYKQTDCHFINFITFKNNDLKDIIL